MFTLFLQLWDRGYNKKFYPYHECEDGIEKSIQRITDLRNKAWRVMTNSDAERQDFSIPSPHK